MNTVSRSDELAAIRAELADLRARVDRPRRRRAHRRLLPLALVALLVALVPLSLLAAVPVTDLDPAQDGGHNPNIDLIYNAGITQGCTPTEYCPKEAVTREQMASFLARTAGLGTNPPVVNAARLGGRTPDSLGRLGTAAAPTPATLGAQDQEIAAVELAVPAPGYVLLVATHELRTVDGKPGSGDLVASFQCNLLGASRVSPPFAAALEDSVGHASGTLTHVFPMDAAKVGTHRFSLRARLAPGSAPLTATATLTALYVPFGPTGTAP